MIPLGIMLPRGGGFDPVQLALALGCSYYRPEAVYLLNPLPERDDIHRARRAGLQVALTIRNSRSDLIPTAPLANRRAYADALRQCLDHYQPHLVTIECEHNTPRYFAGTPEQYLDQLAIAVEVGHDLNVVVADGGLTSEAIAALTTEELWAANPDQALEFAQRCSQSLHRRRLIRDQDALQRYLSRKRATLETGRQLLQGAKDVGCDRTNFHGYVQDPSALAATLDYLAGFGRPLMCNELGQRVPDRSAIASLCLAAADYPVEPCIWYSLDQGGAVALQNPDGSLRDTGRVFQSVCALLQAERDHVAAR